jgi:hypothetical protein
MPLCSDEEEISTYMHMCFQKAIDLNVLLHGLNAYNRN